VRIRWSEAPNHYESLAVSLRAILAGFGAEHPYDELLAGLGLGAAVVAVPGEPLGWWWTHARDVNLLATARLYGLHLRELHPPEAAHGLSGSAEYAEHFRDSYLPLIRAAVEHEQPVLAWRGWPAPRDRLWGVITAVRDELVIGYTLWHDSEPLPMVGPAHQVYIVEDYRAPARPPTADELFWRAAGQAQAWWAGTGAVRTGLETGRHAYRRWQAALHEPTDDSLPLHRQQSQAVRVHVAARSYLAVWLRRVAHQLGGEQVALAARWANACDRVAERLASYESPEVVRELFAEPEGIDRLCRALEEVCELESAVVAALEGQT